MSLVATLLRQVEQVCREQGGEELTTIRVEVGPLAGVEPLLLHSAFEQLAPGSIAREAELVIDLAPLEARCRACGGAFEVANFHFVCPACDSGAVQVTRGDQFQIVSISIRSKEPSAGVLIEP